MNYYTLIFILSAIVSAEIPKKPDFLHTCPVDDPDINACILQKSKETIPELLKGCFNNKFTQCDEKYTIPNMLPLKLPVISVDAGSIVFKLMDAGIYGLDTAELMESNLNLKTKHFVGSLIIKDLNVNGTYDVDGQIMILPIKGHGPGYLHFEGIKVFGTFDYYLEEKDGYNYIKIINEKFDYTVKYAAFNFESLFNGDKTLGDQMNKILNENWQVFHSDLKPAIRRMIIKIVAELHKTVLNYMPIEVIFPGYNKSYDN